MAHRFDVTEAWQCAEHKRSSMRRLHDALGHLQTTLNNGRGRPNAWVVERLGLRIEGINRCLRRDRFRAVVEYRERPAAL